MSRCDVEVLQTKLLGKAAEVQNSTGAFIEVFSLRDLLKTSAVIDVCSGKISCRFPSGNRSPKVLSLDRAFEVSILLAEAIAVKLPLDLEPDRNLMLDSIVFEALASIFELKLARRFRSFFEL